MTEVLSILLVILNAAYLWETIRMRMQAQAQVVALREANSAMLVERYAAVLPYIAFANIPQAGVSGSILACDIKLTNAGLGPAFSAGIVPKSPEWSVESLPLRDDIVPEGVSAWRLVSPIGDGSSTVKFAIEYSDVFGRKLSATFAVLIEGGVVVEANNLSRSTDEA